MQINRIQNVGENNLCGHSNPEEHISDDNGVEWMSKNKVNTSAVAGNKPRALSSKWLLHRKNYKNNKT